MDSKKLEGSVLQIDKLRSTELDQLFDAILSLESREECYQFFDDLATMNEISSLIQRFHVAKLLTEGHTYNHIKKQTNASTATISRVRRCIVYASDGYKIVLARMLEEE